jgi:endonuclease/exonuclease/phosphatase family metal-dependent hydrolase
MKIVSLNIWDLPLWYVEKRKERHIKSARYFRSLGADIICLQESFNPANRDLFHQELSRSEYHTTDTALKTRHFLFLKFDVTGGLATFSRYPILSTEFVPFSRFANVAVSEFFPRKGVLISLLKTPSGNVRVMNLHLHMEAPFLSKRIRLRQLSRALDRVSGDDTTPTILAGDFNESDLHVDKDFSAILRAKGFTHTEAHVVGRTYRPENPFVKDHFFNRTSVSKRYDFIFYRGFDHVGLVPREGGVLEPPEPLSDHDPILLSLEPESL